MTVPPDTGRAGTWSPAELLALSRDPIAVFDGDATLGHANAPFGAAFHRVGQFLHPGTSWGLLIDEIERHRILPGVACNELRLIEERYVGHGSAAPGVTGSLDGTGPVEVVLSSLSDGGFAMVVSPASGGPEHGAESEVEELMEKVLEACPTSLIMSRIGDGGILYRSPAATQLLGKGRNSLDHFALRSERADFITTLLPDARVDDMQVTGRRADGTTFPASVSARLIDYRGEDVVVSTMDDLTDDIAVQDELRTQREQIFQAEKMSALAELLAGIAHELNNPLSIIVGNSQILMEERADPAILKRAGKVNDAAERCVRIVRTFLSIARDRDISVAPVPVAAVVDAAVEVYRARDVPAPVSVDLDLPGDLPDLNIDEVQISQVLSNLLINAEQALGAEAGRGLVRISARARNAGRQVRLRVSDNGPGVPADVAGRIFDPLFTTKPAGMGTGVGLALCHRIVSSHGGSITLDPAQRDGACFVIDLPAV